jgi:CubicO group peptidase (beta-lactamase class C family)
LRVIEPYASSPRSETILMDFSRLQEKLEEALQHHQVVGASVALYHKGAFKAASAGVVNVATGVALTHDTVMHIGSIAKVFTTTVIMQLVDEGCVHLDDLVIRYLPNLRLQDHEALQKITVEMLLNHSSGIDGDVQPDYGHDEETIDKAINRFAGLRQIHDPGVECSYCNGGFVILGHLAQCLTGKSWYELIKERIYRPLGMHHAVTLPEEALLYRASIGHYLNAATGRQVHTSVSLLPLSFAPGGTTLMMSATDLITFARTHLADGIGPNKCRILSERSAHAMRLQTVHRGIDEWPPGFGLGWMVLNHGLLGHSGGAPGVFSMLYLHPKKDFAAALLTNSEHGRVLTDDLLGPAFEELCGTRLLHVQQPDIGFRNGDDLEPGRYVGTYENVLSRYEISRLPSGLGISMCFRFRLYDTSKTEMTPVVPLQPLGRHNFIFKATDAHAGALLSAGKAIRVVFKTPDIAGQMQHISLPDGRLYRRQVPRRAV